MSDLLPCPFCGGDASHYYRSNPQASGWQHDVDHWVCCDSEDCWATMGLCESKEEATTAWNRRALPAAQPDPREAALRDIARQKKSDEMDTECDVEYADFEGGYNAIIDVARRALPAVQPGHVNETPKREHVPDDVLTRAAKGIAHD